MNKITEEQINFVISVAKLVQNGEYRKAVQLSEENVEGFDKTEFIQEIKAGRINKRHRINVSGWGGNGEHHYKPWCFVVGRVKKQIHLKLLTKFGVKIIF